MSSSNYKLAAAILIVLLGTVHLCNSGYRDWNSGADTAYVLGLLALFFWKEKIDDERVKELKLKALTIGFLVGYAATFASKLVLRKGWEAGGPRTISGMDFMFVTLAAALALFHWWRWLDGRAARGNG